MTTTSDEQFIELIKTHYCIVDEHGAVSRQKLERCLEALRKQSTKGKASNQLEFPIIHGVPYLLFEIQNIQHLKDFMPRICNMVHENEQLLALSFNNPLRLAADNLGIAFTPQMAKAIRLLLKKSLRFDDEETASKRLSGIRKIAWVRTNGEPLLV